MLRSSRMRVPVSCNLTLQAAAGCSFCDRTPEVVELSQIIRACLPRVSPTSLMSPPPPSCLPHLPHVSPISLMSPPSPSCHPHLPHVSPISLMSPPSPSCLPHLPHVTPTSLMSPPSPSCLPHLPHVSPISLMSPPPPSRHPHLPHVTPSLIPMPNPTTIQSKLVCPSSSRVSRMESCTQLEKGMTWSTWCMCGVRGRGEGRGGDDLVHVG